MQMTQLEWTTQKRKVNDLVELEINPRKITEAKKKELIASIEKFNLVDIPAIDFDNSIISGKQRLTILKLIGRGEEIIDVRMPNRKLTPSELKEYILVANTHAGEWDFDILEVEFSDFDMGSFGISIPDFGSITGIGEDSETPAKKKTPELKELKPFSLTHVLISFPPEKLIEIQEYLEKIKSLEFIEYEQSSN